MPGGLAGQPVPGSQSGSLRRHPARTSGGFGNSGTSEKGDKPHPRPERSVLLAVDQQLGAMRPARRAAQAPGAAGRSPRGPAHRPWRPSRRRRGRRAQGCVALAVTVGAPFDDRGDRSTGLGHNRPPVAPGAYPCARHSDLSRMHRLRLDGVERGRAPGALRLGREESWTPGYGYSSRSWRSS
jgi:hypothetical protein